MIHLKAIFMLFLVAVLGGAFPDDSRAADVLFTGTVTDSGGKTVEDAEVFIYDSVTIRRPADFITPRTGSDGKFSIRLPKGKYWAVARVRKGDKYGPLLPGDRHSGEPVEVEPGSDPHMTMNFTVADIREVAQNRQKTREDFLRLSGRIVDQEGKPLTNAYVFARDRDSREGIPAYISRWTGDRGEYVLFLPRGKYIVRASRQFPPDSKEEGTKDVSVELVKKETVADIVLNVGEMATHPGDGHADGNDE